jgi:outer membrane protein OmpA-like peptidoglycan-associated protein
MTTRKILLAVTTITLLMTGCAQKKNLNTTSGQFGTSTIADGTNGNGTYTTVTEGYEDNTGHYDNVDPYGNGNYGGNGAYGNNGGYTDGSKGYGNGSNGYGNGAGGVQNVYFDVDQYTITSDKLAIISHNASLVRGDIQSGAKLKIEGHCDATGSDEYNYALGLRRAKSAKDAMVSNGINSNDISLMSMGESSPDCTSSSSADCYSKNRRAEFKVFQ